MLIKDIVNEFQATGSKNLSGYRSVHIEGIGKLFSKANHELSVKFLNTAIKTMKELIEDIDSIFSEFVTPKSCSARLVQKELRKVPESGNRQDLNAVQVFAILSHCFLVGTSPKQFSWKGVVGLDFKVLFTPKERTFSWPMTVEKLHVFMDYFVAMASLIQKATEKLTKSEFTSDDITRVVRVISVISNQRPSMNEEELNLKDDRSLCKLTMMNDKEGIENHQGLQLEFAHKDLGGPILQHGGAQEEIRFFMSPELFVGRLVKSRMKDADSISIFGTQRFNSYTGYLRTFKHQQLRDGDWQHYNVAVDDNLFTQMDQYPQPEDNPNTQFRTLQFKSVVGAIDALNFARKPREVKYAPSAVFREATKVCSLLETTPTTPPLEKVPFLTGNWGCGVYQGDVKHKFLLQWAACSLAETERELIYFPFGEKQLAGVSKVIEDFQDSGVKASTLLRWLMSVSGPFEWPNSSDIVAFDTKKS